MTNTPPSSLALLQVETPTLKRSISGLKSARDAFVKKNIFGVTHLGLSTKKTICEIFEQARSGELIDTYVTLCPLYDTSGGISGSYEDIKDIPPRYRAKLEAAKGVVALMREHLPLRVTYILANQWVVVSPTYNEANFNQDIEQIRALYQTGIDPRDCITTFSEIGLTLPPLERNSKQYTSDDVEQLLLEREIYNFGFAQRYILEQAFGPTATYFFIKNYLDESRQVNEQFSRALFINTEACQPLNTIYQLGTPGQRLVDTNALASVTVRI